MFTNNTFCYYQYLLHALDNQKQVLYCQTKLQVKLNYNYELTSLNRCIPRLCPSKRLFGVPNTRKPRHFHSALFPFHVLKHYTSSGVTCSLSDNIAIFDNFENTISIQISKLFLWTIIYNIIVLGCYKPMIQAQLGFRQFLVSDSFPNINPAEINCIWR